MRASLQADYEDSAQRHSETFTPAAFEVKGKKRPYEDLTGFENLSGLPPPQH